MANIWDTIQNMEFPPQPQEREVNQDAEFAANGKGQGPKTIRYRPSTDIILLREILAVNPLAHQEKWTIVTENVNSSLMKTHPNTLPVNNRSIRERFEKLLKAFRAEQMASLRRSGTAEEFTERDQLLTELVALKDELATTNKQKQSTHTQQQDNLVKQGVEMRKRAMVGMKADEKEDASKAGRTPKKKRGTLTDYTQMKMEEINLRREELKFQREQFDLEKEERRNKMAVERQKDEQFLHLMKGFMDQVKK